MMSSALKNILTLARNTFKETVRSKVLYGILAFSFVYMLFTMFLGSISLGEDLHVIRSLGLSGIYLFGVIITVYLGTSLLYKEIERKTLYFILSKPVSHAHVLLGKFCGLFASVAVSILGMTACYLLVVALKGGGLDVLALVAVLYELAEIALLIALSIFFSTFSAPLASALYAILVIYIGHSLHLLIEAVTKSSAAVQTLVKGITLVLPNLAKFDIRNAVIYDGQVSLIQTIVVLLYAFLYVSILLYGAIVLFKHREL